MPLERRLQDASLTQPFALPSSTSPTNAAGLNLPVSPRSDFAAEVDFLVTAPALNATQLPNAATMTYSVQTDTTAAFASPTTVIEVLGVQIGVSSAGAAGSSMRFRLQSGTQPFVRAVATGSGNGDCSGQSATFQILA